MLERGGWIGPAQCPALRAKPGSHQPSTGRAQQGPSCPQIAGEQRGKGCGVSTAIIPQLPAPCCSSLRSPARSWGSQGAGIPFVLGERWQGKGRAGSGQLGWAASGACSSPRGAGGCSHTRMLAQTGWVCEADTSTCLRVAFSLANVNAVCQPMDNSPSFPPAPCPLLPNPKSDKS